MQYKSSQSTAIRGVHHYCLSRPLPMRAAVQLESTAVTNDSVRMSPVTPVISYLSQAAKTKPHELFTSLPMKYRGLALCTLVRQPYQITFTCLWIHGTHNSDPLLRTNQVRTEIHSPRPKGTSWSWKFSSSQLHINVRDTHIINEYPSFMVCNSFSPLSTFHLLIAILVCALVPVLLDMMGLNVADDTREVLLTESNEAPRVFTTRDRRRLLDRLPG